MFQEDFYILCFFSINFSMNGARIRQIQYSIDKDHWKGEMTLIRFGVIGTNWITDSMIEAALQVEGFQLTAVYSRTEEKAKGES